MAIIASMGNSGLLGSYECSLPTVKGVPIPNCSEALEWWYVQAEEDLDRTLSLLTKLEALGKEWVNNLLNKITDNCLL
jgi:hypothetical protein